MLIVIFLVCLLAISAVSATEENTTDEVAIGEDNSIIGEMSDDVFLDSQEDVVGDKDDGTFTALQNKINNAKEGSKITLENDYVYKESDYTIKINKSVTINGNNHIINGLQSRIIHVDGSYLDSDLGFVPLNITVKMENIRFNQGDIYLDEGSNLIVKNCSFTNNEIKYDGGAIHSDGNLIVQDSLFTNNVAYNGGAIYSRGDLLVENCVFNDNHAWYDGGAIYAKCFYNTGESIIWSRDPIYSPVYFYSPVIKDSTFTDNLAGGILGEYGYGGAIFAESYENATNNYAEAINSIFKGNQGTDMDWDEYWPVQYPNDVNYAVITTDCIFISNNLTVDDVTKYYGDNQNLVVNLADAKGNAIEDADVNIVINGKTSTVTTDYNGQASMSLNLEVGTYDVVSDYKGVETTSKVTVKSTVAVSDASGTYSNSKVSAKFLNTNGDVLASKQVAFTIDSKTYTSTTDSEGVATANIDLNVGNYTVTAVNPINKEEKQFKLTISKANSKIALASSLNGADATLTATLVPAAATGSVIFNVNGENRTADIKSGKATLTLSDLKAGNYTANVLYNGDNNLNASTSNTITFSVADAYPVLTAKGVTKTYGTSTKLTVYLKDNKGNAIANAKVNVTISSKVTTITTNSDGKATMAIGQAPGTYYAKIVSPGAKDITAKIVVKKATPKITSKAKTFKKSVKTKKYTVTLKVNNKAMKSTKVTLKVNKKTYSAKTNSKGVATFKITKLTKKGKYTATVKYAGSKYYNAKSVKVKITVK